MVQCKYVIVIAMASATANSRFWLLEKRRQRWWRQESIKDTADTEEEGGGFTPALIPIPSP